MGRSQVTVWFICCTQSLYFPWKLQVIIEGLQVEKWSNFRSCFIKSSVWKQWENWIRKGRTAARKVIGGLSPTIAEKLVIPKIVLVGMERREYIWYLGIKWNSTERKLYVEMRKGDKTTYLGFPFGKIAQCQVHFSIREDKRKRSWFGKEDHFWYINFLIL